jgi:hypothetical protein
MRAFFTVSLLDAHTRIFAPKIYALLTGFYFNSSDHPVLVELALLVILEPTARCNSIRKLTAHTVSTRGVLLTNHVHILSRCREISANIVDSLQVVPSTVQALEIVSCADQLATTFTYDAAILKA